MEKVAAAYIRVSTDDQIEYSPVSQMKRIREYADKNGYILPDNFIFIDEGISGKSTKNREGFNKMIVTAKKKPKPFDTILVWKFSRFARSREDSIVYKSMLRKELGIKVISVSEDVGDDKMSVIFESMIEAMDEYYSINLAEEVKRGMLERIKQGKSCSIAPFGYRLENKELVVIEEEAEIIKDVFESFVGGEGCVSIARRLNSMGIRTRRGGKIENRTVEYWLCNPVYKGKVRWNPEGKTKRYHWNGEETIITDGMHRPIVAESLWNEAQERFSKRENSKVYKNKNPSSWLVGIFKCGVCGGNMVNTGGYFYCGNKIKGACTGAGGVKAEKIENQVKEFLKKISHPLEINVVPINRPNSFESLVKNEEKKLERIKRAYSEGVDTIDEYKKAKKEIMAKLEELKSQACEKNTEIPCERCLLEILESDCNNMKKAEAIRCAVLKILKMPDNEYKIFLNLWGMEDQMEN